VGGGIFGICEEPRSVVKRDTETLATREYDLLVIGGGIFGVCAAWDAALRGLSVALVEKGDFAHATTANSYKIAHGGVRYLQHGDLKRVRESSRERSALIRVAPHLVYPLPILIPTYGHGLKGKAALRAGFFAYDLLTLDRNRGIADPARRIPRTTVLSVGETLDLFPGLPRDGLTGAVVFCDGQMYNPPRLALSFLRSAVDAGAHAANYVEVTGFLREGHRVRGVTVNDLLASRQMKIRSRIVLNATGPWVARLLERGLGLDMGRQRPSFSRDVGLVTRRRLHRRMGLACAADTRDSDAILDRGSRHLFLLPWRDYTMVGVWHGLSRDPPDEVEVGDDELREFVAEANRAYPGLHLRVDDITMVNTGLILFGDEAQEQEAHSFGKHSLLIDHGTEHVLQGLITLIGVRATTARGMAEKAVDLVLKKLGREGPPSATEDTPIYGGDFESFPQVVEEVSCDLAPTANRAIARGLAHNHGSRYREVLAVADEDPELATTINGSSILKADIVHAVREEMARHLLDVVSRRTDLGTAGDPGPESLGTCAALMARELDWDEAQVLHELEEARSFFSRRGAHRAFTAAERATGATLS